MEVGATVVDVSLVFLVTGAAGLGDELFKVVEVNGAGVIVAFPLLART